MKLPLILFALALSAGLHAQTPRPTPTSGYPAPIQALVDKGMTIKGPLQAPAGFKGYAAEFRGRPLPVYLLPDGKHMVVGSLLDAQANDLTQSAMREAGKAPLDASTWAALEKTTWIAEGSTHPRHVVYVLTDTECPYCHRLWQAVAPMLKSGDVQVRHVLVAVIAADSLGRAAAILGSADPAAALNRHEKNFGHSPVAVAARPLPAAVQQVRANTALMQRLGFGATPTTFYKDASGAVHSIEGLMDATRMKAVFDR